MCRWIALVTLLSLTTAPAVAQSNASCARDDFEEARLSFHRAWFEQADKQFLDYIRVCPDDAVAHGYAAIIDMLLFRDHKTHVADAMFHSKEATSIEALFALSLANFARGELQDAEKSLRQYLLEAPDDRYASHVLGFTLIDQDRAAEGVDILTNLLESHPGYFPALNHLAYGLLKTGKTGDAVRVAGEFVAADPDNPSTWDTRAGILHALGRNEEAIASLRKGLALDDRFAYGYRHLGNILSAMGDVDGAREAYYRAIRAAALYGNDFVVSVEAAIAELDNQPAG